MLGCELATSGGGVEFWERSSMTASAGPIAVGKPPTVAEGTDITEWEMFISIELIDRKGCLGLAGNTLYVCLCFCFGQQRTFAPADGAGLRFGYRAGNFILPVSAVVGAVAFRALVFRPTPLSVSGKA